MSTTTRPLPVTQTLRLTARLAATWIHGRTGQQIEETTLPIGALLAGWATDTNAGGETVHTFLATEDGGTTWNRFQSYATPQTEQINPRFAHTTGENGSDATVTVSRGPKPPAAARKAIR